MFRKNSREVEGINCCWVGQVVVEVLQWALHVAPANTLSACAS